MAKVCLEKFYWVLAKDFRSNPIIAEPPILSGSLLIEDLKIVARNLFTALADEPGQGLKKVTTLLEDYKHASNYHR